MVSFWTIKRQDSTWVLKNWCFWIVVLEKTFENPLDCKEINPKGNKPWLFIGRTCWSWSFSTLGTWCEELTHWKRSWCWERGQKEKGWQRMRWLHSIPDSVDMNLSKLREIVKGRGARHAAVHGVTKSQTPLSKQLNWGEPGVLQSRRLQSRTWLNYWTTTDSTKRRLNEHS